MVKTPTKTPAPAKARAPKSASIVDESVVETGGDDAKAAGGGTALRLKDLIDVVMNATGAKAKDVREIVLATLTEMGAALDRGDALNLPEFGKGRVARRSDEADGSSAIVLKLRRGGVPKKKEDKEALAEVAE